MVLGIAAGVWFGTQGYPRFAVLVGWSIAALVFTVWTWAVVAPWTHA
ncbi:hypothetical protein NKG05_08965 [Oerskovia sp. M15]